MTRTKTEYDHVNANDNAVSIISLVFCHKLRIDRCRIQRYREELADSCQIMGQPLFDL
jgi:hypothetical protein